MRLPSLARLSSAGVLCHQAATAQRASSAGSCRPRPRGRRTRHLPRCCTLQSRGARHPRPQTATRILAGLERLQLMRCRQPARQEATRPRPRPQRRLREAQRQWQQQRHECARRAGAPAAARAASAGVVPAAAAGRRRARLAAALPAARLVGGGMHGGARVHESLTCYRMSATHDGSIATVVMCACRLPSGMHPNRQPTWRVDQGSIARRRCCVLEHLGQANLCHGRSRGVLSGGRAGGMAHMWLLGTARDLLRGRATAAGARQQQAYNCRRRRPNSTR